MKAFVLDTYRKGAALVERTLPDPQLGPSDVLIRIGAAGLNVLDLKIRDGAFKPILPYKTPLVLGHDLAGTVVGTGAQVDRFCVGDVVYARARDGHIGTFADMISVHQDDVAMAPANLSMTDAAGVPLVVLTAWQALVQVGNVQPGQKVFVQTGSGGVGSIAIQLAKHLGATVATTCGAGNMAMVRELGADIAIDDRTQDFGADLSGYDLVLHSQDDDALMKSLSILKPGGLLISISGPPTPEFAKAQGLALPVRLILGFLSRKVRKATKGVGARYTFLFIRADGRQLAQIATLIEAKVITPVTDRTFPFHKLNDAMTYLGTGRAKGKVIVTMDD